MRLKIIPLVLDRNNTRKNRNMIGIILAFPGIPKTMMMNSENFDQQIYTYADALKSYAFKFTSDTDDANDLVQDTMMKALRFAAHYQQGTNLKAWLFVILKNTFINNFRRESRKFNVVIQEEEISSPHLMTSSVTNQAVGTFVMGDIQKAIASLPVNFATPFVRYVEGYKYEEIAEELNIPLGTVKTRIHTARELLKKRLEIYKSRIN